MTLCHYNHIFVYATVQKVHNNEIDDEVTEITGTDTEGITTLYVCFSRFRYFNSG